MNHAQRIYVAEIDAEHQFIFGLLARFDADNASRVFDKLDAFVAEHFSREEALMAESQYPDLEEHRRQHAHLARRLEVMRAAGPWMQSKVSELRRFLTEWLESHIGHHDKAFGQWLLASMELAEGNPAQAARGAVFVGWR